MVWRGTAIPGAPSHWNRCCEGLGPWAGHNPMFGKFYRVALSKSRVFRLGPVLSQTMWQYHVQEWVHGGRAMGLDPGGVQRPARRLKRYNARV